MINWMFVLGFHFIRIVELSSVQPKSLVWFRSGTETGFRTNTIVHPYFLTKSNSVKPSISLISGPSNDPRRKYFNLDGQSHYI